MRIQLELNGANREIDITPNQTLLEALRGANLWSVKHGCETGECGACSVIFDGKLVPTCIIPAASANGHSITTVEGLTSGLELHPIQQAFAETGAIQCGYCTPAMILATKALLDKEINPSEAMIREALSSVLCRCTGYVKPVEAALRAAAVLRGEEAPPIEGEGIPVEAVFGQPGERGIEPPAPETHGGAALTTQRRTVLQTPVKGIETTSVVGRPEMKVDAVKLAKGKPAFTADIDMPGMLCASMLTSPYAHARIRDIDVSQARALPGVHAVLTYKDIKREVYASGGQSYPNPKPWDQVSLDNKVRYVGDRVAVVAADTPEMLKYPWQT